MLPVIIPAIARPLPLYLDGSFLIFTNATAPKTIASGPVKSPMQNQPNVTLKMPIINEATAKLCDGGMTPYLRPWP
jgi:hypothetical protein